MKKTLGYLALAFIFCFIILYLHVNFVEVVSNEEHSKEMESLNVIKISESDMEKHEEINMELKKFYDEQSIEYQRSIKFEKLIESVDNYVQRYISLFLITTNLLNHTIKDPNENITVNLEISISGKDLIYLQEYSKSSKSSSYERNFSKLDAIFSKVARNKKERYMEDAMKSSWTFFRNFNIFSKFNNFNFSGLFSFFIILLMTFMVYHYIFRKFFWRFIGILINSMILWESLQLYRRKLKEADIEIYVNTLQYKTIPEDCDPVNIRWYHSITSYFSENKCLHYYKSISKDPVEEVSLLKCIIDTYSFYLFQTPFRIFGASIRDFTGEISALWPWPFNYLMDVPIATFFGITVFLVILILCGKRLRVSFLGTRFEIGNDKVVTEKEKQIATSNEILKREPIRVIQKLRPWTKTRCPKRLDLDLGRRRRFLLKASKSVSEFSEKQNELEFNGSSGSLCDSKVKHD